MELEKEHQLLFLDVLVNGRTSNSLACFIDRQPTDTGSRIGLTDGMTPPTGLQEVSLHNSERQSYKNL
jgi:hypothetical protein